MRRWFALLFTLVPAVVPGPALAAVSAGSPDLPSQGEHSPLTPAGWRIDPAGPNFGVDHEAIGLQGPLGSALSPDGSHLLTTSSGAARMDSVDLFNVAAHKRVGYVPFDGLKTPGEAVFYGIVYSPDGRHAWASGGGQNVVHEFDVDGDAVHETGQISTPYFPAGLAYGHTPLGDRIYVANNLAGTPSGESNPPGHQVTVIDPATEQVTGTIDLGKALDPFGVTFDRTGKKAYVTEWMGRSVAVVDTTTQTEIADVQLSPASKPLTADHPNAITANPHRDEVYTANGNSDTVSVIDTKTDRLAATIDVSLIPNSPKGAVPDGLTVGPDGHTLYVAEAGENAIAVVNLDSRRVEGFVPTAWYPSDVKVTPDGRQLVVTNRQGTGAGPNPCGPMTTLTTCPPLDPARDIVPGGREGVPDPDHPDSMIKGSITLITLRSDHGWLQEMTRRVERDNDAVSRPQPKPPALNAIKHVIYVIKENRTYDQVFGNLGRGNGDPALNIFGDDSAPNHRALARRFVTLDNFYINGEDSNDGHYWANAATASDYLEDSWPIHNSPKPRKNGRAADFEGGPTVQQFETEPLASDPSVPRDATAPTGGYLWDNAFDHGVSFRDYGEFTEPSPGTTCGDGANASSSTRLQPRFGNVDPLYPSYDTHCVDHTQREPEWEREFRGYETNGNLPALEFVRLPNDHAQGTASGEFTPQAYMADNDLALGRMVQAVSHSRYWKDTAIFVAEDDPHNGADHVDAHRSVGLVISPYTQIGKVDSTHYSVVSMVATIEQLLGLPPMSINDQRATRMWPSFTAHPNFQPYDALQPTITPYGEPGAPKNP
jgi:YVTN family beta-propeller protein